MFGRRFAPLSFEGMTEEQQAVANRAMTGPLKQINPSLNAWLRSPMVADPIQRLGSYLLFDGAVPKRLKELVIMMVARHWTSQYPWTLHYSIAIKEGIKAADIEAIAVKRMPASLRPDESLTYDLAKSLLEGKPVSDATYGALVTSFGEQGVIDLIGLIGYYSMVCMIKNIDEVPSVEGVPLLSPNP